MNFPAAADLQRWSAEVARDPASPAFVPLARAFRRQGRREAALRLCVRGLEHNPAHVDGHLLLALLYLDAGDRDRACDEWGIVLRLEPDSFEAHRGMGFFYLERGDYPLARRHLERASTGRPGDPAVREALTMLRERGVGAPEPAAPAESVPRPGQTRGHGDTGSQQPGGFAGAGIAQSPDPASPGPRVPVSAAPGQVAAAPVVAAPPPAQKVTRDPSRLFEPMLADPPFIGAMIIDRDGLVLAGTTRQGSGVEALGAVLAAAIDEAVRAARHLDLGSWRSILLEAAEAVVHMSPLTDELALLMAVRREAPTGWVLRSAARAQGLARAFLGADA